MTNEDDLWQTYAKNVKKIKKTKAIAKAEARKAKPHTKAFLSIPAPPALLPVPAPVKDIHPVSLERRTEKNLRAGDIELDARIDLHGMTQAEAFEALARFMAAQAKLGRRRLLIITGKGRGKEGVLRTNLPGWLQSLPEAAQILALRPSAPKHGGDGAYYVLMKKRKSPDGRV